VEKSDLVTGNSSALMEKLTQLIDAGITTGGSIYSAKKAETDIAHAIEYYSCFALDSTASKCDFVGIGVLFLPKTKMTLFIFAGCSATSTFSRTLRKNSKEMEGGLFGCKN